jgi:CDP-2,3-bis-(O-geranylgeranyl)-sn-glycerol synthase
MYDLLRECIALVWVCIPAAIANMVPVFAAHMPIIDKYSTPMDFGWSFRGRRILGDHKTWRGLAAGIVTATIVFGLQSWLSQHTGWGAWMADGFDYTGLPIMVLGVLFAVGALGGDALKSFFKRQIGIAPGKKWFPFDQIDYIIGAAIAVSPYIRFSLRQYILISIIGVAGVMATTYIGWLLKLKESPL